MSNKFLTYFIAFFTIAIMTTSCGVSYKKKRYIKQTYKEIKKTFPEAQVNILQDSIKVIFPNNVVFDIGAYKVKQTFKARLDHLAKILNKYDKTNLLITGHTDNSGNEADNLQLSLNRASGVKAYLEKISVASERLFTWGLGEKSPIVANDTELGRAKNRRVEFVVLYKPTP